MLLDLPVELVVQIAQATPPRTHYSLSLTCKALWNLFKDDIALHKTRSTDLVYCYMGELFFEEDALHSMEELPAWQSQYIEYLDFPRQFPFWDSWMDYERLYNGVDIFRRPPREHVDFYLARIKENRYIRNAAAPGPKSLNTVESALQQGSKDLLIAHLLTLFPNILHLHLRVISEQRYLLWFFMDIIEIYQTPSSRPCSLPLQFLREVKFEFELPGARLHNHTPLQWAMYILQIPTLRSLEATHIKTFADEKIERIQPFSSNVKRLVFKESYVKYATLAKLLCKLELECFSYINGWHVEELAILSEALKARSLPTLTNLVIKAPRRLAEMPVDSIMNVADLAEFPRLRNVVCRFSELVPDDCRDVTDVFPRNLTCLELEECTISEMNLMRDFVAKQAPTALPLVDFTGSTARLTWGFNEDQHK